MNSHITSKFRKAFRKLSREEQEQARRAYRLFIKNSRHPSLKFKPINSTHSVYSVRISLDYRALGSRDGDEIVRFWIGSHAEYDKILRAF